MHTAGIIYRSFILPVLDYCDTIWNCCGRMNADNIEKLQRGAARIIVQTNINNSRTCSMKATNPKLLLGIYTQQPVLAPCHRYSQRD